MGYYDSVKDNVKNTDNEGSKPGNFETLRKAAEEESEEESEGDNTEIEVLEEGLNQQSSNVQQSQKTRQKPQSSETMQSSSSKGSGNVSGDLSSVEDKLDRIIDQNERMIEILESFGS